MKMKKQILLLVLICLTFALAACSGGGEPNGIISRTQTSGGHPLGNPKNSINYQLGLLKAGEVDRLKTCFTERVRDQITAELVKKAQTEAGKYSFDDLYDSEEILYDSAEYPGEKGPRKVAKIKMKNGRTLTTLVETGDSWLADTIWFK